MYECEVNQPETTNRGLAAMQVAERRAAVCRMYLRGKTQTEIATQLGVHVSTVTADLRAVLNEWRQQAILDFHQARLAELARINSLEREYWEAYERSRKPRKQRTAEQSVGVSGQGSRVSHTETERDEGDVNFLRGVQWCIEKRCQLLGLDAPMRIEQTHEHVVRSHLEGMSESERRELLERAVHDMRVLERLTHYYETSVDVRGGTEPQDEPRPA